ncbi:hypothetical protein BDQ17DRAFT_524200 [Cyathus striatus]|nr:hypothetical protein BDQ17DRAFT_524200 [Cyathus striatus]
MSKIIVLMTFKSARRLILASFLRLVTSPIFFFVPIMVTLQFGAFSGLILLCSLLSVRAGPHNVTIDDTDSSFNYTSSPAWDTIVWDQQSPQPLNGTNHGSTSPGAEVTFKFTGTAFYMYGYKWSDHGFRTITVDGTRTIQCDGRQGEQGSRSLIFSRENLTYTEHTVVIENTGTQGQYINIDYAIITQNTATLFPQIPEVLQLLPALD